MTDTIPADRRQRPPIGAVVLGALMLVLLVGLLVRRSPSASSPLHPSPRDPRPSSSRWRRMRSPGHPVSGTGCRSKRTKRAADRGSPVQERSTFEGIASPAVRIPAVPLPCCCSAAPTAARWCLRTACSFRPMVGRGKRFPSRTRRRCAHSSIRAPFRPPSHGALGQAQVDPELRTESCGARTCQVGQPAPPPASDQRPCGVRVRQSGRATAGRSPPDRSGALARFGDRVSRASCCPGARRPHDDEARARSGAPRSAAVHRRTGPLTARPTLRTRGV